jgi:DNA polymerase I-like protein with 3'-5' exonuclease and polymerase domains
MRPPSLFDSFQDYTPRSTWVPEAPPDVSNESEVFVNFETSGLRWWDGDLPIGMNVYACGRSWYLPFGHVGGGNLDERTVYRFAQSLRGKRLTNINTRFEAHMGRCWGEKMGDGGLDFDAMGCTLADVGHQAALLDDHRLHLSLDSLIPDYLGEAPMKRVDERRMKEYHAGEVAARSMYGIEAVKRLQDVFWPMLGAEDLHPVRILEEETIHPTVEMEKNGSPINEGLLDQWLVASQRKLEGYLMSIAKDLGWQCNPDSPKDMEKAFRQLGLAVQYTKGTINKPGGSPSFTNEILGAFAVEHDTVAAMARAVKLASLRSKFLVATKKFLKKGVIYYALHQLRATKDDDARAGEAGTVTGRYSSSALEKYVFGCNIQQRMKAAKQRTTMGFDENDTSHDDELYILRKLHIAQPGYQVVASDMDQAQYRIFASYANNPAIIEAYRKNPNLSFHKYMHELIKPYADLTYRQQKDLNFAYLFGAWLVKMGLMLHHLTKAEFEEINRTKNYNHPKLQKTKEVRAIYEREVPEMKALLEEASHLAKPECDDRCKRDAIHRSGLQHRGYVKDAIGRRMRFPDGQRLHKAFNGVDQMTEASYMKTKLVEVHKARHETGFILRITNHDEIVGDGLDDECKKKVDTLLNRQSFPQLRVPLTWSTGIGPSWAETK